MCEGDPGISPVFYHLFNPPTASMDPGNNIILLITSAITSVATCMSMIIERNINSRDSTTRSNELDNTSRQTQNQAPALLQSKGIINLH